MCKVEADAEDPEINDGAEKTENGSENGIPKTYCNKKAVTTRHKFVFLTGIKFFFLVNIFLKYGALFIMV